MMTCRRVQPLLLDFSSGRLDARTADGVASHLEGCAECRRVLKRERRTAALLGSMTRVESRADAWVDIEVALHAASRPSRLRSAYRAPAWRPAVWAVSLVAAVALGANMVSLTPRSTGTSAPTRAYTEAEALRSLAPAAAAGLGQERASDPLVAMQSGVDRLLDSVTDQRS